MITIKELMDEISELKEFHKFNVLAEVQLATHSLDERYRSLSADANRMREERAAIAGQLYQYGLFLDSDGVIKKLNPA